MDLEILLSKLNNIKKELGGPTENLLKNKNNDEFNAIKLKVAELINDISKKQDKRDEDFEKLGRTITVIKAGVAIQEDFTELNVQLAQMKETVRRQKKNPKKFPVDQMEIKEQQFQKYSKLAEQLRNREDGEENTIADDEPLNLAQLKLGLTGSKKPERADIGRQLNEIEEEAIKRFKKNDEEMDLMVNQVNDGLDVLKTKAIMIGEQIDRQEVAIGELGIEVDKAHDGLVTSNARLKKILYTYRKPSKFCCDVIMILFLLGLIAVIIKLATQK